jgi:Histidine kinase-, DNA gyrase B-, and HSP90-like ATPase
VKWEKKLKTRAARFQVDSRLAKLLSQEYASTERAIKELVDNAWDADADEVRIDLPAPMTSTPIIIRDNGSGMTRVELEQHYLFIASDRRAGRGQRTAGKQRLVKGRKGIGKFAGLMAATEMTMTTQARGTSCTFTVRLKELAAVKDIERLPISIASIPCASDLHGTEITLSDLHASLAFPDPRKLRQILLQEYGRATDFRIFVDGKALGVDDVDGTHCDEVLQVEGVGEVKIQFAIAETKSVTRQPGLVLRVDGKVVGKPSFFGLDEQEDFPQRLLSKLHGEINADGLKDHVTAGWDSVVPLVRDRFKERYGRDMQLTQARLQREVKERLSAMPEFRREYAERAIQKVLDKFFGEPPSKYEPFIFVLLEAIERSDYGTVLQHLADASRGDVASVAEALNEFGL